MNKEKLFPALSMDYVLDSLVASMNEYPASKNYTVFAVQY